MRYEKVFQDKRPSSLGAPFHDTDDCNAYLSTMRQRKHGHDYKGAQKYHGHACESYGTLQAQQGYDEHIHTQVKRAVVERISLRGIERLFGISRRTVVEWIQQWAGHLPPLETALTDAQLDDVLELDELWSFVLKKANQRWVWVSWFAVLGKLSPIASVTAVKRVVFNSGDASVSIQTLSFVQ